MFKFEKLDVWKKSIDLYEKALNASVSINQKDQFSLGEQKRRAVLSVSANIAEGSGR